MQLIVVRGPFARVAHFTIKRLHCWVAALFMLLLMTACILTGAFLVARYGHAWPVVDDLVFAQRYPSGQDQSGLALVRYGANPLDTMAVRLAEINSQLAQLHATGERLLRARGLDKAIPMPAKPGQGGLSSAQEEPLRWSEFKALFARNQDSLVQQAKVFDLLDNPAALNQKRFEALQVQAPLRHLVMASGFGTRIDPFSGRKAQHEGLDFIAPTGTPIVAVAEGVVKLATSHPGFGLMVELSHEHGVMTRYAHASKLLVKTGERVAQGQTIALVGSTGRSTGPHLHFEVHVDGAVQNPDKLMAAAGLQVQPRVVALSRRAAIAN
jgi:murein DD-endopeptidase MepM/ murein hydrolase activator NlpD